MAKELGEILERKPSEVKPQESKPEPKVEAKEPKPEIPADRNEAKPKDDKQGQAKAPDTDGEEQIKNEVDPAKRAAGFEGAYKSEKTKRKEREAEAERWKAEAERHRKEADEREQWWKKRFDTLQTQQRPAEPPKPRANLFENPEQWEAQQQAETQSAISNIRFQFSEKVARVKYGDEFDQAAQAASVAFDANPHHPLRRIMQESADPGEDLVNWYRKETVFEKTGGNLDEFKKRTLEEMLADPKTKEEILAKLNLKPSDGQEQQQQESKPQTPAPHELPTNLAGARNVSGRAGPIWTGPKSLSELIPSGTRKR